MISLGNFLLLAAIANQIICVVSKVIRYLGLERAVVTCFLESTNIQYRLKCLTSGNEADLNGEVPASTRESAVCNMPTATARIYLRNHNIQDKLAIREKAAV